MKYILIILLFIFAFTSCHKLDGITSDKVDRILSADHFTLLTYQVACIRPNKTLLTKDINDTIVFTTELDSEIVIKHPFTADKKIGIKKLLEKSYNKETADDTGPGNGNRFYWFYSDKDTIHFFNNSKDIYKTFVEINGETLEHMGETEQY